MLTLGVMLVQAAMGKAASASPSRQHQTYHEYEAARDAAALAPAANAWGARNRQACIACTADEILEPTSHIKYMSPCR